ncbi:MAG: FkbM family methyltransferase [Myxococcota bacterium]
MAHDKDDPTLDRPVLAGVWRTERQILSRLPRPLKRAYLGTNHFLATQLRTQNLRFPVSSPRFGTMLLNRVDTVNAFIYFLDVWEPHITAILDAHLHEGDVFIDVGANIGYYSLCASRLVGETGRVYALEASPTIFARLERHIAINRLTNVVAKQCAVWDSEGELDIFLGPTKNEGNTSLLSSPKRALEAKVRAAPLHALIDEQDLGRVKMVKIDVEGAETQVIRGMVDCLDRMSEDVMVLMEVTKSLIQDQGGSVGATLAPFEERGFRYFAVPNEYNFGFYLRYEESKGDIRELSFDELLNGPEPRFDLVITRKNLNANSGS